MGEKGLYVDGIHGVCNYIRKIFTNETFVKYCRIHSLMKTAMIVIIIYPEEIEAVAEFKGDNGVINYPIAYVEVKV